MRYKVSESLVTREVAVELLAVPVGVMTQKFNGMITFSESGQLLWKAMVDGGATEEQLITILREKYDCSESEAGEDVRAFVEKLVQKGLVQFEN